MNELRLRGLLQDRYKTNFGGLQQKFVKPGLYKPCGYSNNLAAHPCSNNTMTRPLKLKIQDALNNSLFLDAEGMGIFVGGRRRNRKNKNKKKNGQNKKKCKKNNTKSKRQSCSSTDCSDDCPSSGRSSPKSEDQIPLLTYCVDENENFDPSDPYSCFCTDKEDAEPCEMSFLFKKKAKEVKAEAAVVSELQTKSSDVQQPAAVQEALQDTVPETKPGLEDSLDKAVDGGTVTEPVGNDVKPSEETNDTTTLVDGEPKVDDKADKSEKSPLVSSKDGGPGGGCLCCTIL